MYIIYLAIFFLTVTLFEMFYRSDRFSFKSLCFKNPIRPTLTNVLQIRKVWLFVTLLMFYRSEWLGFAPSQNVLQIRTPRFSFFQIFYRSEATPTLLWLTTFHATIFHNKRLFYLNWFLKRGYREINVKHREKRFLIEVWSPSLLKWQFAFSRARIRVLENIDLRLQSVTIFPLFGSKLRTFSNKGI